MYKIYHPLVYYAFYHNLLSPQQLKLIPKTTLSYWRKRKIEDLYGYDWIEILEKDILYNYKKEQYSHIRFIGYLCSFFQKAIPKATLKNYIRKNSSHFIFTFERLYSHLSDIRLTAKVIGVSYNRYYRLKNKFHCTASVLNLCMRSHPAQLSTAEAAVIESAVNDPTHSHFSLLSIYYKLLNSSKLFCSIGTFYKYAALLRNNISTRKALPPPIGFRAKAVFEFLHVDTTFVQTENDGKIRVVFVKDNFSKAILTAQTVTNGSSAFIRSVLEAAFNDHHLPLDFLTSIVSDDGSENKGEVLSWVASFDASRVVKLTAKIDFPFSNSMVESTNHLFKNVFLRDRMVMDRKHLDMLLIDFVYYANVLRYPGDLYGYSPTEVLQGAVPDRNRFKFSIGKARRARVERNRKDRGCGVCEYSTSLRIL